MAATMTAGSRCLASMRRRMIIENGIGIVLNAVVGGLASFLFHQFVIYEIHSDNWVFVRRAEKMIAMVVMLMSLSWIMLAFWLTMTVYLLWPGSHVTKLKTFLMFAILSSILGAACTARTVDVILYEEGLERCQAATQDRPGDGRCHVLIPANLVALVSLFLYPLGIYTGRLVSFSKFCRAKRLHNITLEELAHRAAACTIDAEVAGLKTVTTSSTVSTNSTL
jgi:hypothetical protein